MTFCFVIISMALISSLLPFPVMLVYLLSNASPPSGLKDAKAPNRTQMAASSYHLMLKHQMLIIIFILLVLSHVIDHSY